MKFNTDKQIYWQKADNAIWFTNKKMICDLCNVETDKVLEYRDFKDNKYVRACFDHERMCFKKALEIIFQLNPELEFIYSREIVYVPISKFKTIQTEKNKNIILKSNDLEPKYTLKQLRSAWAAGKYSNEP